MSDLKWLIEQHTREAYERGRREGHAAGMREERFRAACADPAVEERARQFAWAERWAAGGDVTAPFNPPAQGWPEDVADVDVYVENFIQEQVMEGLLPAPTSEPAGPLTAQLRQIISGETK